MKSYIILIFSLCLANAAMAQCPVEVYCDPGGYGITMVFDRDNEDLYLPLESAYFYFGEDDLWTGTFNRNPGSLVTTDEFHYFTFPILCQGDVRDFFFEYTNANGILQTCTIRNGEVVETPDCVNWVKLQEDLILGIIDEHINKNLCRKWEGECNDQGLIYRDGPVRINYSLTKCLPEKYLLGVNRSILTEEYKVCDNFQWCDYVFLPDYELLPLKEVQSFISQNGYLPGMPSAQEVEDNQGFELLDISILQQEKIEEGFLHLIDLNNRLNELEKLVALPDTKQ